MKNMAKSKKVKEVKIEVELIKIGNSQGVIIDKKIVDFLNLKINDKFDITIFKKT